MKRTIFFAATLIVATLFAMTSLVSWKAQDTDNTLLPQLSQYHIYKGPLQNLIPESGFHVYTLATPLFTDYAEKQRLISSDSSMLVKTFYYYNDIQDTTRGRRIIETRLMIRSGGKWQGATYVWNEAQTDAILQKISSNTPVSWITAAGEKRTISYHIPSQRECGTCHNNGNGLVPIGLKLPSTARAFDNSFPLADQARAYLDINCAHCHNPNGYARGTGLFLTYTLPLEETGILKRKDKIISKFQKGKMPLLGTTVVHKEGLQLLKDYLAGLP